MLPCDARGIDVRPYALPISNDLVAMVERPWGNRAFRLGRIVAMGGCGSGGSICVFCAAREGHGIKMLMLSKFSCMGDFALPTAANHWLAILTARLLRLIGCPDWCRELLRSRIPQACGRMGGVDRMARASSTKRTGSGGA